MTSVPQLSIVIPAYNEGGRISQTLGTLREYLQTNGWEVEVIVVDDGSTDATATIVKNFGERWRQLRLIQNPGNQGKGYSVKHGALQAKGDIILFTDADLSAPVEEMPKLVNPIREGKCDLSFGSRAVDRSLIGTHQPKFRELSGRLYNLFVQMITGLPFKDTQCGFKSFRREAVIPALQRLTIADFGFDPELLYIAKKRGLRLKEIPVRWNHAEGTKVHFVKDAIKMFLDLAVIRWNDLTGKYG
jgi:glycosyltransferase involved in cell wall biosynthesis